MLLDHRVSPTVARPPGRLVRWSTTAALLITVLIVIGGGVVRVTSSGLGCPDWPACTADSFTSATATTGVHGLIEFANRALTTVVGLAVLAVLAAVWREQVRTGVRRRALWWSALAQVLMVALNAVVGGITVLTGLNPYVVGAHFLAAVLLLSATALSYDIAHRRAAPSAVHPVTAALARGLAVATGLLVIAGVVVTGAGPHPGDSTSVKRIPLDWTLVTVVHGSLAVVVLAATVGCVVVAGRHGDALVRRRALVLAAVIGAQALLGIYQSVSGLPAAAVVAHLLGACLVWVGSVRLLLAAPTHRRTDAVVAQRADALSS